MIEPGVRRSLGRWVRRGVASWIRLLIRLTPAPVRDRYGPEVLAVHRKRMRAVEEEGFLRLLAVAYREFIGGLQLVWQSRKTPTEQHLDSPRQRGRRSMLDVFWQDIRFAWRMLNRNRLFTATTLAVVALGIGSTTAIFSAVNAYFFRPLPFAEEDRLVGLFETNPEFNWDFADAAPANALDWRDQVDAFADVALYSSFTNEATLLQDGEPTLLGVASISGNFFSVLGVRPALGTTFTFDDTWASNAPSVVLSHATWTTRFGADPSVIGRTIDLAGRGAQVIGVMPEGFSFPSSDTDAWATMQWDRASPDQVWFRRAHFVRPIARLEAGTTVEQANAQLQVVVERLQQEYPETNRVMGAGLLPLREFWIRDVRRPLMILAGAVLILLLLSSINVANLMLVRAGHRAREMAVRMALGAGRRRVARQMVTESLLLALGGGVIGLGIGWAAVLGIERLSPLGIDGATGIALDLRVLAIAFGTALACGVAFGLVPLLTGFHRSVHGALSDESRGGSQGRSRVRTSNLLVGAEVALAVLLVLGAGLVLRSFLHLRSVDPGFRVESVLAVQITVPASRYEARDDVLTFWDRLAENLEARPGVQRVGTVGRLPLDGTSWSSSFKAEGWPADRVGFEILHRRADRGYFDALGIPLIEGRHFAPTDGPESPLVVVVNERFANEFFPGESAIGQKIAYDREPTEDSNWYEIIGVVGDQHQVSPGEPVRSEVFESRDQDWSRSVVVVLRTDGDPTGTLPTVRGVLAELDPLVPMGEARSLRYVWRASTRRQELILTLLGSFGVLALVLAAVGVYGVTAQAARRRTREIGIRIALGADRPAILRMMLRDGIAIVGAGLLLGVALSAFAGRALAGQLFGVRPSDPSTVAAVVILLGAVSLLANLFPALRSTKVDPMESLRTE